LLQTINHLYAAAGSARKGDLLRGDSEGLDRSEFADSKLESGSASAYSLNTCGTHIHCNR